MENTILEIQTEFINVSIDFADTSKCLDLVSGAGFKRITDKAIRKFNEAYPSNLYNIEVTFTELPI